MPLGFNSFRIMFPAASRIYFFLSLFFLAGTNAVLAQESVPADAASIERGGVVYRQYCTECHGGDGRAQVDVISDATDLTEPDAYYSGSSRQDIYNSIAYGAGVAMPAWQEQIGQEDIGHLVNFIRSLWSEEQRQAN